MSDDPPIVVNVHVRVEHMSVFMGDDSADERSESAEKTFRADVRKGLRDMTANLEKLRQEVKENGEVMQSAVALISGLSARIREAIGNDEALEALASELDTNSNALAAAVAQNTVIEEDGEEPVEDTPIPDEGGEDTTGGDTGTDTVGGGEGNDTVDGEDPAPTT